MTVTASDLPKYNWDQAAILGLATSRGFGALGVKAATVRQWAHRGAIAPCGRAPGGAYLYPIDAVSRHADRTKP